MLSPVGATRRGTLSTRRSCGVKSERRTVVRLGAAKCGKSEYMMHIRLLRTFAIVRHIMLQWHIIMPRASVRRDFVPSVAWRCSSIARHLDPHLGGRLQAGAPFLDAVERADASATCRRLVSQDIVQAAQRCSAASEDQPAMLRASSRPGILTVDVSNARR